MHFSLGFVQKSIYNSDIEFGCSSEFRINRVEYPGLMALMAGVSLLVHYSRPIHLILGFQKRFPSKSRYIINEWLTAPY
jgi:hypothetical protein